MRLKVYGGRSLSSGVHHSSPCRQSPTPAVLARSFSLSQAGRHQVFVGGHLLPPAWPAPSLFSHAGHFQVFQGSEKALPSEQTPEDVSSHLESWQSDRHQL